jgi:hypothetical protein
MKNSDQTQNVALAKFHDNWPVTNVLPEDARLRIVFHGLLSFCFNNNPQRNYAEIGVFNKSPNHKLRVVVYQGQCPTGTVIDDFTADELTKNGEFTLEVPNTANNVASFQDPNPKNPNNFSWLTDIEGPDFFDSNVPKKAGHYKPTLIVKRGVFYTHDLTASTFKVREVATGNINRIGPMAYFVGAYVKCNPGEGAVLTLPRHNPSDPPFTRTYRPEDGMREIHFINSCVENGNACTDSDFHHHLDSIQASHSGRFVLEPDREVHFEHTCQSASLLADVERRSTDPAPCASTGYGRSPGTP